MRTWCFLLIGFSGLFGIAIPLGLMLRWNVALRDLEIAASSGGSADLMKLVWNCAAAALIPAVLGCVVIGMLFRKVKRPSAPAMGIAVVACLALGIWGGALQLWKLDRIHQLRQRDSEAQHALEPTLESLKKQGKYDEMVREMERVLDIHEELVAETGSGIESCNHGYSYLFCSLHPASEDIPPRLGFCLSWCLFDAWHVGSSSQYSPANPLSKAMTRSKHPLLRALAHWVEQDYAAFEQEALAGAAAGDQRMDALALTAACVISTDKKMALDKVRPILDRGVGLGRRPDGIPCSDIRAYLDGSGPAPRYVSFMNPPGRSKERSGGAALKSHP